MKFNLKESLASWKTLNPREPWMWPTIPRYASMTGFIAAVVAGGYFFLISPELLMSLIPGVLPELSLLIVCAIIGFDDLIYGIV